MYPFSVCLRTFFSPLIESECAYLIRASLWSAFIVACWNFSHSDRIITVSTTTSPAFVWQSTVDEQHKNTFMFWIHALDLFFFVCCRANVSLSQFYSQLELRCYCIMWYCQRIQPIFIDSTQFLFFHPQFNLKWKESTIELDQFRESDFTTTKWREDKRVIVCECLPSK